MPAEDISAIAYNADNRHEAIVGPHKSSAAATDAAAGATLGAVVGGGAGLLAGLGMLTIPGIGPVVAAGWLVATAAGLIAGGAVGGASGGIIGALTDAGLSKEHAHIYAEGIRRGGTLVTARVDESRFAEAEGLLLDFNAVDPAARAAHYRATGWEGFDESAAAYDDVKVGDRYRDPNEGHSSI